MENFIKEFYYGNLDPRSRSTKQNKAVQKHMGTTASKLYQKCCKPFYNEIRNKNKLYNFLLQQNQDTEEMFKLLVKQMVKHEGVTEKLKVKNQLEWVSCMNNIRNRAIEIANDELIYV